MCQSNHICAKVLQQDLLRQWSYPALITVTQFSQADQLTRSLAWLQWVQNNAAQLMMKKRRQDHTPPLLKELHWLPVKLCCQCKTAALAYYHFERSSPPYLSSSLHTYKVSCSLLSSILLMKSCSNFQSKISDHSDNVLRVSWHHQFGIHCQPLSEM